MHTRPSFFISVLLLLIFYQGVPDPVLGQGSDTPVGMKPDFGTESAEAQQPKESANSDVPIATAQSEQWVWRPETVLALAVIVFSLAVLIVQLLLVMRDTVDWTPNTILRFFGLTLIINGGVLLVVAGFSSQQIAGVLGLLGSIAGYLLGASSKGNVDGDDRTVANSRQIRPDLEDVSAEAQRPE